MSNSKDKGGILRCINISPLIGNDGTLNKVAPPLKLNEEYVVKDVFNDSKGNPHLDVGLKSDYEFVRSIETGEDLPNGDKIHWCHPSRFEVV